MPGEIRDVQVRIGAVDISGSPSYTIPEQVLGVMSYSQQ